MGRPFQVVSDDDDVIAQPPVQKREESVDNGALQILLLALKTVSQRTLIAISNMFTLFMMLAVWYSFYLVLPNPSINQIVTSSIFAVFCLMLEVIRRR